MFLRKRALRFIFFSLFIFLAFVFIVTPFAQAQYWEALPPYNLLWPLWSPTLSPIPATGMPIPVPLLTALDNTTVLPVQPVLAWDPAQQYPWLLYNTPASFGGGLTYFDAFYGLNPFPAPYLLDAAGLPAPVALPVGFSGLAPTELNDFAPYVSIGNLLFVNRYPIDITTLLTAANLWGLPATGLPLI